jgi:membrane protease YdiL (CAAX protease family)
LLYALAIGQRLLTTSPAIDLPRLIPVWLDNDSVWYMLSILLIAALLWLARRFPGVNFNFYLRWRFTWTDVAICVVLGGATFLGLYLYAGGFAGTHSEWSMFGIARSTHPAGAVWFAGILFALVNALTEELWYRGLLLGSLVPLMGRQRAIFLHALVFGLFHWFGTPQGIMGILLAGAWGYVLGWWAVKRCSLWPAFVVHVLADLLIFLYT